MDNSNVLDCGSFDSLPIIITIPAGMHGIVSIEFQGERTKTMHLRRCMPSGIEDDESTIAHLRNCDTNVSNSIILRGPEIEKEIKYELDLVCYETSCNITPASGCKDLELFNCSGGTGTDGSKVSAFTMVYDIPSLRHPLPIPLPSSDNFTITIVCQQLRSPFHPHFTPDNVAHAMPSLG
jgi:hypothetical protein